MGNQPPKWQLELFEQWFTPVDLTSPLIPSLLSWLIYLEPPQNLVDASVKCGTIYPSHHPSTNGR